MRVTIAGYFGFGNAGDEFLLEQTLRDLRETVRPDVCVLTASPAETAKQLSVATVPRANPVAVARALVASDVLLATGELIQDYTSFRSLLYYCGLLLLARLLGNRVILYGAAVARLRRPGSRLLARASLAACRAVITRDRASVETLASLGLRRRVRRGWDPVFRYPIEMERGRARPRRIVVAPSRCRLPLSALVRLVSRLRENHGTEVVLLPFHIRTDEPLCRRIAAALPGRLRVLHHEHNHRSVLRFLAGAGMVISTRYHALVLASLLDIPFLGIASTGKVTSLLRELGQPVYADDPDELPRLLRAAHGILDGERPSRVRVAELRDASLTLLREALA